MMRTWSVCREDAERTVTAWESCTWSARCRETLGFMLNPLTREIQPMRLMLARVS